MGHGDGKSGVCVVCDHALGEHIDELHLLVGMWRCHGIGRDGCQCECVLLKARAEGDINFYSLNHRLKQQRVELKERGVKG